MPNLFFILQQKSREKQDFRASKRNFSWTEPFESIVSIKQVSLQTTEEHVQAKAHTNVFAH